MTMIGGTATLTAHNDGTYTAGGTGLAAALASGRAATQSAVWMGVAAVQAGGVLTGPLLDAWTAVCAQIATDATADGDAIITYITTNAVLTGNAQIGTSLGGLQKSTAAGSLTDPVGGIIPPAGIPLIGGVS